MKYYNNPKFNEYMQDQLFVQKLIEERKSQERKDAINAILGIGLSAAVFILSCLAVAFLEG